MHVVKSFNIGPGGSAPIVHDAYARNNSLGPRAHPNKWQLGQTVPHFHAETDESPKHGPKMPKRGMCDIEK